MSRITTNNWDYWDTDTQYEPEQLVIYQYPTSGMSEKDFFGYDYLGKAKGFDGQKGHFVRGKYKDLKALNDRIGYSFHPDYLIDEGDFDYETILGRRR